MKPNRVTEHNLDAKKLYEFAKGRLALKKGGSVKINQKISIEFIEKNIDFFAKKTCDSLKRLAIDLIHNNENPRLPDVLHNKMLAYSLAPTDSDEKRKKQAKNIKGAKEYFEILSVYEKTKSYPKKENKWKSKKTGKESFYKMYRGGNHKVFFNELSEEEIEFMVSDNPYYAYKYAITTNQRLEEKAEQKFLNESPEDYVIRKHKSHEYRLPTLKIILSYCEKFNVALPACVHNKILFLSASGESLTDYRIKNEGKDKYAGKTWREIPESHRCLYRRHLYRYQKFVESLPALVTKKRLGLDNKISELLSKKINKKDKMYLETFLEVQMLDKNDSINKLFIKNDAA